jgi:acyl-CoA synthetase (AMP-forming)/AMP-acid ligase II
MPNFASLHHLLEQRLIEQPDDVAFVFIDDQGNETAKLTYRELFRRAAAIAGDLIQRAAPTERALLVYPPGLEFLCAYFGSLMAGLLPAPMMPPRRAAVRDASEAIVKKCGPRLVLTDSHLLGHGARDIRDRMTTIGRDSWIATDRIEAAGGERTGFAPRLQEFALLQFTSGSTSEPKGVMVSHASLLSNLEMIKRAFGNGRGSTYASWTPLFHDMGLILNALQAVYVGATCYLLAPVTFLHRPMIWLRTISNYRVEVAGCPNFGFDHCVDRLRPEAMESLDLSSWRVAFNGAEPVRAQTLERFAKAFAPYGFRASALHPSYGMAEATLMISCGRRGEGAFVRAIDESAFQKSCVVDASTDSGRDLVACGRELDGEEITIVDPSTRERMQPDRIGEIWVRGPHVAQGYFNDPEATREVFHAEIHGGSGSWLRTGDLGFLDASGNLFVSGRLKDVIILRGANYYPQDIERTVEECHPALRRHGAAAFSVDGERGEERLVVVQEIARTHRHAENHAEIEDCIREAVAEAHDLSVHQIVLIAPGALPVTTSGKVQRGLARKMFYDGAFVPVVPSGISSARNTAP